MVSTITPLNSVQKIPTVAIKPFRSVLSPVIFFTVGTGKKAIIKGKAVCTGLGAASQVRLNAGGVQIVRWQAAAVDDRTLAVGSYFNFEVQLDAGETLDYDQDVGTNGEINIFAEAQETPA